jgi:hypothetical protein
VAFGVFGFLLPEHHLRAALEQAEELGRVLEELGKRLVE